MATNGITSSKPPRKRGANTPLYSDAIPAFEGDPLMEAANGSRGRLSAVKDQPITGLTDATRDQLLRQAGIRVRRGRNNIGS